METVLFHYYCHIPRRLWRWWACQRARVLIIGPFGLHHEPTERSHTSITNIPNLFSTITIKPGVKCGIGYCFTQLMATDFGQRIKNPGAELAAGAVNVGFNRVEDLAVYVVDRKSV